MVVPKFSYITGFGIQVFAIIFMLTEHNPTGGLILFFTGDIQMLLTIGFSDEKMNILYSIFDVTISTVYLGFYIYIYYLALDCIWKIALYQTMFISMEIVMIKKNNYYSIE